MPQPFLRRLTGLRQRLSKGFRRAEARVPGGIHLRFRACKSGRQPECSGSRHFCTTAVLLYLCTSAIFHFCLVSVLLYYYSTALVYLCTTTRESGEHWVCICSKLSFWCTYCVARALGVKVWGLRLLGVSGLGAVGSGAGAAGGVGFRASQG